MLRKRSRKKLRKRNKFAAVEIRQEQSCHQEEIDKITWNKKSTDNKNNINSHYLKYTVISNFTKLVKGSQLVAFIEIL